MTRKENDEAICREVAHIAGDASGAAQAIRELERRRRLGLTAWIQHEGQVWFVVNKSDVMRKEAAQ